MSQSVRQVAEEFVAAHVRYLYNMDPNLPDGEGEQGAICPHCGSEWPESGPTCSPEDCYRLKFEVALAAELEASRAAPGHTDLMVPPETIPDFAERCLACGQPLDERTAGCPECQERHSAGAP